MKFNQASFIAAVTFAVLASVSQAHADASLAACGATPAVQSVLDTMDPKFVLEACYRNSFGPVCRAAEIRHFCALGYIFTDISSNESWEVTLDGKPVIDRHGAAWVAQRKGDSLALKESVKDANFRVKVCEANLLAASPVTCTPYVTIKELRDAGYSVLVMDDSTYRFVKDGTQLNTYAEMAPVVAAIKKQRDQSLAGRLQSMVNGLRN